MSAALRLHGRPGARRPFGPLTRVGVAAVAYLLAVGTGFWSWHHTISQEPLWLVTTLCAAPPLLAASLAFTSQHDRQQYVVRLLAAMMMCPIGLLFWTIDGPMQPGKGMLLAIGFGALHLTAFLLGVRWLAAFTTCIEPPPQAVAVESSILVRRIGSLRALGLPIEFREDALARSVELSWQPTNRPGRAHLVRLLFDGVTRAVTVNERVQADGVAPASADEASMRTPGDVFGDPSRPQARRVWMRTVQTTMIDPARLAAVPLEFAGDCVVWTGAQAPSLADTDGLMACLALIVTNSGWAWRPRLG